MAGLGLLGAALAGGAKGFGQGMIELDKRRAEDESATKRMETAEAIRAKYAEMALEAADARAIALSGKIDARAKELAGGERGLLMDNAKSIYEKSGMSAEDIALGVSATEAARTEGVEATTANRTQAMTELGALTPAQSLAIASANERLAKTDATAEAKDKYGKERDTKGDEKDAAKTLADSKNADRDYDLRVRQFNQTAATAALNAKVTNLAYQQALELGKIPPAAKLAYASADAEVKAIQKSITDAQSNGTWNAETGAANIAALSAATSRMNAIIRPHLDAKTAASLSADNAKVDKSALAAFFKANPTTDQASNAVLDKELLKKGWTQEAIDAGRAAASEKESAAGNGVYSRPPASASNTGTDGKAAPPGNQPASKPIKSNDGGPVDGLMPESAARLGAVESAMRVVGLSINQNKNDKEMVQRLSKELGLLQSEAARLRRGY